MKVKTENNAENQQSKATSLKKISKINKPRQKREDRRQYTSVRNEKRVIILINCSH